MRISVNNALKRNGEIHTLIEHSLINISDQIERIMVAFKSRKARHLLNTAVRIVLLIPDVAEQAARRSFGYHNPISARISPVAVFLLDCSASSRSTNGTYTKLAEWQFSKSVENGGIKCWDQAESMNGVE